MFRYKGSLSQLKAQLTLSYQDSMYLKYNGSVRLRKKGWQSLTVKSKTKQKVTWVIFRQNQIKHVENTNVTECKFFNGLHGEDWLFGIVIDVVIASKCT